MNPNGAGQARPPGAAGGAPAMPQGQALYQVQQQQPGGYAPRPAVPGPALFPQAPAQPPQLVKIPLVSRQKLQELMSQIDPGGRLDSAVEDALLEVAEDFVDSVARAACLLARHRGSDVLEAKDLQLHLRRHWHMSIPGPGLGPAEAGGRSTTPQPGEATRRRLSATRESASSVGGAA